MPQYTFPVNSSEQKHVDRDTLYGVNWPVHLLITTSIVIDLVYSCGLRHCIWSELTCSFTHHNFHCYWLGLFLWTEMLYMELTPCSFTHRSYHCYLLCLFLWTEMLYMELFIYLSQLPLLLVWLILVDWDALYGVNPHVHLLIAATIVIHLLILVDWDTLYGVVHLLIAATIAIGLAYSCGLRHSIWSESIHENLILENSVWVGQAIKSIDEISFSFSFFIKAILEC